MGSWQHAGRMLRGLRENRGWEVPKLAAELKAKATAIGQSVPDRQSEVVPTAVELRWRSYGDQAAASSLVGVTAMVASRAARRAGRCR